MKFTSIMLIALLFLINAKALDKGHKQNVEHYKKSHIQDQHDPTVDIVDQDNDEDSQLKEKCTILDKCRACSFKEMQQIPECQVTGFRLIKRCIKSQKEGYSIVEDTYVNEACSEFTGSLADYNKDPNLLNGKFAEPGSGNASMFTFLIIMGICAIGIITVLNKRKERILSEIYSKISIVNR